LPFLYFIQTTCMKNDFYRNDNQQTEASMRAIKII
jgi:hypothetical protein